MSTHTCVDRVNEHLAAKNTKLAEAISFDQPERELIQLSTVKRDAAVRGTRTAAFFATFCPMCGVKLRNT